ncbi:mechanosensitive ion channel protein MscL [Cohnella nanjingensis]|uniref:Mechanosensitive ion channel protein MscL n=1 Tax=Cohnella nanjingensis TaxID=1387779 RepID=A0A7X0RP21_9BACL|nr:mechanosensitive ion channel protein MscL [Cohnella nanjingensis]MBB6671039.1 mechanosensitive ion channel protein MscL [Cohnella nanjingensis]
MIVFDVIVGGEVKETIKPKTVKLKEIYDIVNEQMKQMKRKYGRDIDVKRRMIY